MNDPIFEGNETGPFPEFGEHAELPRSTAAVRQMVVVRFLIRKV
jgi:hypothetical protein